MRNEGATNGNGHGHASEDLSAGAGGSDSLAILKVGDLVIVEADRGRDLGRVVNDNITAEEVEAWLDAGRSSSGQIISGGNGSEQQWGESPMPTPISPTGVYAGISIPPPTPAGASGLVLGGAVNPSGAGSNANAAGGAGANKKEINPKQIYAKAGPAEASLLAAKMSDELKALQLCQSKVRAKKLPMEVVDAEYQWYASVPFCLVALVMLVCRDRRKLTFYFVADKRIDFRELVRELFRCVFTLHNSPMTPIAIAGCTKHVFGWPHCRAEAASSSDLLNNTSQKEANPNQRSRTLNNHFIILCGRYLFDRP